MALTHLVDTSVLKRLGRPAVRQVVEPLAAADLLVAAAAESLDLDVLHYDSDFDLIASVTGQRCTWVVPPGTAE